MRGGAEEVAMSSWGVSDDASKATDRRVVRVVRLLAYPEYPRRDDRKVCDQDADTILHMFDVSDHARKPELSEMCAHVQQLHTLP